MKNRDAKESHILLVDVDFDSCIFNEAYMNSDDPNRLISCNQAFINHILHRLDSQLYDRVIFMVGSKRQSKHFDDLKAKLKGEKYPNGCCFSALKALAAAIQAKTTIPCEVDDYLLADSYGDRQPGENFKNAVMQDSAYQYSDSIWDEFKYSIIYAHAHKIADKYPHAKIRHLFLDNNDDIILPCLSLFYQKYGDLLPNNLKLSLYHYAGKRPKPLQFAGQDCADIQGQGIIDHFYSENIKVLAKVCGYDLNKASCYVTSTFDNGISDALYPDVVMNFKNQRILSKININYEFTSLVKECEKTFVQDDFVENSFLYYLRELKKTLLNEAHKEKGLSIMQDTTQVLRYLLLVHAKEHYDSADLKRVVSRYIRKYGYSKDILQSSLQCCWNFFNRVNQKHSLLQSNLHDFTDTLRPLVKSYQTEKSHLVRPNLRVG